MVKPLPSRAQILETLKSSKGAVHARDVAAKLKVEDGAYQGLLRMLDDLVFQGVLSAGDGHRFKVSKRSGSSVSEEREGSVSIAARGFGFVASPGSPGDDVYVAPTSLMGAMHGDRVIVHVRARGARGSEGEVIKILSRGTRRVAGVLRRRGKSAWLEPDDTRIQGLITLPDDIDVSGPEGNSGKDGDAAVVTITRYPEVLGENAVGKLEAVLGTPGELRVEVAKILVTEQIEEVHSEQAFHEAEAYGTEVPIQMLEGREDLTHLPLPTIDPEDARDHDDAVWVERSDGGGYRAWIAIADVSAYVRPGTKTDEEAKARGCSVYLPDRAIPMLPRPLSSNLCSLLPDVVRLCLCAEVELDAGGTITKQRLVRGFMKSRAKLTYGSVARALRLTDATPEDPKAEAMVDGLRVALELSTILRGKRMKRGALDFELPEPKIILDPSSGFPTDVQRRAQDAGTKRAYQLIEELMLLANEVVARYLVDRTVPTVFRVHAPPDPAKLEKFAAMCETLGVQFEMDTGTDPKKLSTLLKKLATHPNANVLNMLLLRSMKQATYDITNIGHFGLASKAYAHFTSPIRRYPDLVVHRAVHGVVLGEKVNRTDPYIGELAGAALQASTAERRAMEVEREVMNLYRAMLMRDKVGQRYEGTVTGLVGSGLYVALDAPFVDVLVKFDELGGDRYELDDDGMRAVASRSGDVVKLGDRMMLEVIDVAILRRTVYGRRVRGEKDAAHSKASRKVEKKGKSERPTKGKVTKGPPKGKSGAGRKKKFGRR